MFSRIIDLIIIMDLVGEIVERDIVPPLEPAKTESGSGFPSAKKLQEKRLQKRQERQGKSTSKERELPTKIKSSQKSSKALISDESRKRRTKQSLKKTKPRTLKQ